MQSTAYFFFHGNVNDFLPKGKKNTRISYSFNGTPALKDAIEAIGVPHVEVDRIELNNQPAIFFTQLRDQDSVAVYSREVLTDTTSDNTLRNWKEAPHRFVLDVHLGALCRQLRLLGFDSYYNTNNSDQQIAALSEKENRIVLTRDIDLLKQKVIIWGYWLRSQHTQEQLLEVIRRFQLHNSFAPFTRCLSCNEAIFPVKKEEVLDQLPDDTRAYFDIFYQCSGCRKVYWKGSHYTRMMKFIEQLREVIRR